MEGFLDPRTDFDLQRPSVLASGTPRSYFKPPPIAPIMLLGPGCRRVAAGVPYSRGSLYDAHRRCQRRYRLRQTVQTRHAPAAVTLGTLHVENLSAAIDLDRVSLYVLVCDHERCLKGIVAIGERLGASIGAGINSQIHTKERRHGHDCFIELQSHAAAVAVIGFTTGGAQTDGRGSNPRVPVVEQQHHSGVVDQRDIVLVREPRPGIAGDVIETDSLFQLPTADLMTSRWARTVRFGLTKERRTRSGGSRLRGA
jgi:hypothetical protein